MKHSQRENIEFQRHQRFARPYLVAGLFVMMQACSAAAPTTVDMKMNGDMNNLSGSAEKPYGSASGTGGTSNAGAAQGDTTMPSSGGEAESEAVSVPGTITGDTLDNMPLEAGQILRNGVYQIKSQYSKKCIRVPESKRDENVILVQYDCENSTDFKWRLNYLEHKYYNFTNIGNGQSIQIANQSASNEAFIEQASYVAQSYQMWVLVKNNDGTYLIKPRGNTNLCLDVAFGSMNNSTQLQLWRECNGVGQKWLINPVF